MRKTKTRCWCVISKYSNQIYKTDSGRLAIYDTKEQATKFATYCLELEEKDYKIRPIKLLIY